MSRRALDLLAPFLALVFVVAVPCAGHAEPFAPGVALDQATVAQVVGSAFAFIAPRSLEAVPLARLAEWSLRGLAGLDPRLRFGATDEGMRLLLEARPAQRLLFAGKSPGDADATGWGNLLAEAVRAAWDASQPVRRVGTGGVIRAMLDEVCNHLDPYSRYATPAETEMAAQAAARGDIGIALSRRHGGFVVADVREDGPAARAGVRAGDMLLAIDGQGLGGAELGDVWERLAGPEDSSVSLALRDRAGHLRSVDITRAMILPQTVHLSWIGPLPVLRVSDFGAATGAHLAQALSLLSGPHKPRGVVIDLRGNRGGLLREAVDAAESMLDGGIIAVTEGRDPAAAHEFRAEGEDRVPGMPVVVLVDGRSASAAEILAAALADQHRAVVVGSATYGKGLVQAVSPLPDGGTLFLSWSRVLAPLGWPIQGLGVLPQVCTSLGTGIASGQLEALSHGLTPLAAAVQRHRAARAPLATDVILQIRGTCPATASVAEPTARDPDVAVARYLVDHPTAYATALLGPPPP